MSFNLPASHNQLICDVSMLDYLEEQVNVLARQTDCIKWRRKFSGADLVQIRVFDWLIQPHPSLEMLASLAAT